MFLFKKIFSSFLFPLPLCLGILMVGLLLLWFSKKQKSGRALVTTGTILLLLFSYAQISDPLLMGLEEAYPSVTEATDTGLPIHDPQSPIQWIVVLGGGQKSDPKLPITSHLGGSSLMRLIEGIRLYRKNPASKLILSGGSLYNSSSEAEAMARVAQALGVPQEDIVLEDQSWDTEQQAQLIGPMVDKDKFLLVTSASHMLRAMSLFEKQGMHPTAAPTDHLVWHHKKTFIELFLPNSANLSKTTTAFYEYMGLAWLKIRGKI